MTIFQKVEEPGYENIAKFYGLQEENKFNTEEKFNLETTLQRKMWGSWENLVYVGNINRGSLFTIAKAFKDLQDNNIYLFTADNFIAFGQGVIDPKDDIGFGMFFDFIKQNHEKLGPIYEKEEFKGYAPKWDPFTVFKISGLASRNGYFTGKLFKGMCPGKSIEARDYVKEMDVLRGVFSGLVFDGMENLKNEPFYKSPWGLSKKPSKKLEKEIVEMS